MSTTRHVFAARLAGTLLLISLSAMVASAVIATAAEVTLNPSDPSATVAMVHERVVLHFVGLGFDVIGWLGLLTAALVIAARMIATDQPFALLPAGLLAAAGITGLLHNVGNLAVTHLAAVDPDLATVAVAEAILRSAAWGANLAGLLWVVATATAVIFLPLSTVFRRWGVVAAVFGVAAVALPWASGVEGLSLALEQAGYVLFLPIWLWYGVYGWRELRTPSVTLTFDDSTGSVRFSERS